MVHIITAVDVLVKVCITKLEFEFLCIYKFALDVDTIKQLNQRESYRHNYNYSKSVRYRHIKIINTSS